MKGGYGKYTVAHVRAGRGRYTYLLGQCLRSLLPPIQPRLDPKRLPMRTLPVWVDWKTENLERPNICLDPIIPIARLRFQP